MFACNNNCKTGKMSQKQSKATIAFAPSALVLTDACDLSRICISLPYVYREKLKD